MSDAVSGAPWWLPGGHLQTIWAAKLARRCDAPVRWQRERWDTPDDDFVDVDWLVGSAPHGAPLLVLLHGLEGSTQSHYAEAFADTARQRGWRMAVPHFRGCSGEINRQPRAYHSGDWQEIDWLLSQMQARHDGRLYVVGISLGGNALMRWAGEMGRTQGKPPHHLTAIASICSPLDLVASGLALERGLNRWIYTPMFLQTMKPKARAKWEQFPGLFDLQRAMRARTLCEFDDAFTAPVHGFRGVMDYWTRASAKPHMTHIRLPALALNACNDPFIPAASLPTVQDVSDHVTLWQPAHGGHVGFASGRFPARLHTLPETVADWFAAHSS
jgi:predicted alpha/beta-fold hydrolase